jgi:hypothetical protein
VERTLALIAAVANLHATVDFSNGKIERDKCQIATIGFAGRAGHRWADLALSLGIVTDWPPSPF